MIKANFRLLVLICAVLLSAYSCTALKGLADMQKPTVSVADFNITDFSLSDVEITFDVEVDNPNPAAVTLTNYDYDLQINSNSFMNGRQSAQTIVEANSKSNIQIPVRFSFQELYGLFSSLANRDETDFNFAANAGIKVPVLGQLTIPFNYSGTFPVLKLPKFDVAGLKLASLSFTKADFEVNLSINNPNMFDLNFNNLDYQLKINGLSAISGQINKETNVARKSTTRITLPLSVNILQLGANIRTMLTEGGSLDYELAGNTVVGSSLPFFKPSPFNFDRTGSVLLFN